MASFQTKKSLGQYFLNNERVPEQMCAAGEVAANDVVVEIGPGTGVLTRALLGRGARVIAIETDSRALAVLAESFQDAINSGQLTLVTGDMRTFDLSTLPVNEHGYKVVANIPYYLTGRLFRTLLTEGPQPTAIVFLTQKEVARRVTMTGEEHGTSSLLSLSVQFYGTPKYVTSVPRGNFTPQPKVDSAIVAVTNISRARESQIPADTFFSLIRCGFGQKRKQLLGNLTALFPRETIRAAFDTCNIPADARAETLDIDTWCALGRSLHDMG